MNKRRVEKRKTSGPPYAGVQGKVVERVEHRFEEGLLFIDIRFMDKTALCWSIGTAVVIQEAHLSDWKSGNSKLLKRFVRNNSGQV